MSQLSQSPAEELGNPSVSVDSVWDQYTVVSIRNPRRNMSFRGQWWVASESARGKFYKVSLSSDGSSWQCDCWAFRKNRTCKHIEKVWHSPGLVEPMGGTSNWDLLLPLVDLYKGITSVGSMNSLPSKVAMGALAEWEETPGLSERQKGFIKLAWQCGQLSFCEDHQWDGSPVVLAEAKAVKETYAELFSDSPSVGLLGVVESLEGMLSMNGRAEFKSKVENALFWLRQIL